MMIHISDSEKGLIKRALEFYQMGCLDSKIRAASHTSVMYLKLREQVCAQLEQVEQDRAMAEQLRFKIGN